MQRKPRTFFATKLYKVAAAEGGLASVRRDAELELAGQIRTVSQAVTTIGKALAAIWTSLWRTYPDSRCPVIIISEKKTPDNANLNGLMPMDSEAVLKMPAYFVWISPSDGQVHICLDMGI